MTRWATELKSAHWKAFRLRELSVSLLSSYGLQPIRNILSSSGLRLSAVQSAHPPDLPDPVDARDKSVVRSSSSEIARRGARCYF
jgi:hypothetical protein